MGFELKFERMKLLFLRRVHKFASEAFGAVRTINSLTLQESICARYEKLLCNLVRRNERKSRWPAFVLAISDSVDMLCMALAFWYGGKLISSGEYNLKNCLIIYNAIMKGSKAAGNWMSFGPNMAQTNGAANRVLSSAKPVRLLQDVRLRRREVWILSLRMWASIMQAVQRPYVQI